MSTFIRHHQILWGFILGAIGISIVVSLWIFSLHHNLLTIIGNFFINTIVDNSVQTIVIGFGIMWWFGYLMPDDTFDVPFHTLSGWAKIGLTMMVISGMLIFFSLCALLTKL